MIVRKSIQEIKKMKSRTDWKRVDAIKDDEIDYSEIPELDEDWFKEAIVVMPRTKVVVTLRIDPDVLAWFKKQGSGYQTRINALLRAYMDAQSSQLKSVKLILVKLKRVKEINNSRCRDSGVEQAQDLNET